MLKTSFTNYLIEAGVDEAGRGSLSGPVVAAAVILPPNYYNKNINDSKKLSQKKRLILRKEIIKDALFWSFSEVSHLKIDNINILNASFLAMHKAIKKLKKQPELLLIDGNKFKPYQNISHHCIVKGDSKYISIAAASILAKTFRDEIMEKLHFEYPVYGWNTNKGYATKKHIAAIDKYGYCPLHRKSFHLKRQLKFNFDYK